MFVGGPESSAGCRGYYISNIEYDVDPDTGKISRGEIYLNTNSYDDKTRQKVAVRSRPSGETNPAKDYPNPKVETEFPNLGLVSGDEIAIALSGQLLFNGATFDLQDGNVIVFSGNLGDDLLFAYDDKGNITRPNVGNNDADEGIFFIPTKPEIGKFAFTFGGFAYGEKGTNAIGRSSIAVGR